MANVTTAGLVSNLTSSNLTVLTDNYSGTYSNHSLIYIGTPTVTSVTIDGFYITGMITGGSDGAAINIIGPSNSNITITRCRFYNNHGGSFAPEIHTQGTNTVISLCYFDDTAATTTDKYTVEFSNSANSSIINSIFNGAPAVQITNGVIESDSISPSLIVAGNLLQNYNVGSGAALFVINPSYSSNPTSVINNTVSNIVFQASSVGLFIGTTALTPTINYSYNYHSNLTLASGTLATGLIGIVESTTNIIGNIFNGISMSGSPFIGFATMSNGIGNFTVSNNIFNNVVASRIVDIQDTTIYAPEVYNNTVYYPASTGTFVNDSHTASVGSGAGDLVAKNNILYNVATAYSKAAGATYIWAYNDYYGGASQGGTGSVVTNPLFVNAATGDFHLQPNSPVLQLGTNIGLAIDASGNPMTVTPDLGAYQYQPFAKFFTGTGVGSGHN
jgi:hypothetical protein